MQLVGDSPACWFLLFIAETPGSDLTATGGFLYTTAMKNLVVTIVAAFLISASLNVATMEVHKEPKSPSSLSPVQIAEIALEATVLIITPDSQASGFAVSHDGMIVTNNHAIRETGNVVMLMNEEGTYVGHPARVIITDPGSDLAILKIEAPTPHFLRLAPWLPLVKRGQFAAVMSAPHGLPGTFSTGVISALRFDMNRPQRIQTTAPVSPGSSGSALLNDEAQVVGVITSILIQPHAQSINMATSVHDLHILLEKAKEVASGSLIE